MALFRRRPLETDAILNGALDAAIARRPELAAQFDEPEPVDGGEFTLEEADATAPNLDASLPGLSGDALRSTFTDALGSRPVAPEAPPDTIDPWASDEIARIAPPSAGNAPASAPVRRGDIRTARGDMRPRSLASADAAPLTSLPSGFTSPGAFRQPGRAHRNDPMPTAPRLANRPDEDPRILEFERSMPSGPERSSDPLIESIYQREQLAPVDFGSPVPTAPASDVAAPGLAPDALPATEQTATAPGLADPVPVAPGLPSFAMTEAEQAEFAKAQRRDRRLRIAQAVLGGAGGLIGAIGAASGSTGAMGFGGGLAQGMQGNYATNARGVMQDVNARRAQDMQRYGLENAAYRQQVADQRAARQDERQAQEDALNAEYRRSQIDANRQRIEQVQNEINATGADAAAARNIVRHFAAGLNDDSPAADELRAAVNSPEFDGASAQTARDTLARYTQLANRRGAGLIDNGGGGGGFREVVNADGTVTRVRVGGGGGGGGVARRGGSGSSGASAPAPSGPTVAASELAGEALSTDEDQAANVFIDAMTARGIDPASDSGRRELRANLYAYRNAPSSGARADVINDARARISVAAEAAAGGLPPGVTRQELASIPAEAIRNYAAAQSTERFLARLERYNRDNPDALRLALSGAGIQNGASATALDIAANRIRGDLQGRINAVLSDLSGANVTPNEMERNLRALGVGSVASNFGDLASNFRARRREQDDIVRGYMQRVSPATREYWLGGGR